MRIFKIKTLILALAICLTGAAVHAQSTIDKPVIDQKEINQIDKGPRAKKSPEDRAARRADRMAEKLNLDENQKAAIMALNLKDAKIHEARKRAERDEREARRIEKEKQYKSILTAEQFKKYQTEKLKRKADWKDADGNIIPRKKRMKKNRKKGKGAKACCSSAEAKKCCAKDCAKDCCAPKN